MNPITLPTTPEQRDRLEKAGWSLGDSDAQHEYWQQWHGCTYAIVRLYTEKESRCVGPLALVLEFAAVLGIHPSGYRLIPEDVAQAASPFVKTQAKKMSEARMFYRGGLPRSQEAWENADQETKALEALASALPSDEGKAPHG